MVTRNPTIDVGNCVGEPLARSVSWLLIIKFGPMIQRLKIRVMPGYIILMVLFGCAATPPQTQPTKEPNLRSWRNRVSDVLQPGWEVIQLDRSIMITRKEAVTYYNPIALPPPGELRFQLIERSKRKEIYQITLEVVDRLSNARYEELKAINQNTERQLEAREDRMRSFAGKGDYLPTTSAEHILYKDYQNALANLPYHKLPDLFDEKHSIYVKTTRPPWSAFYSGREEQECRAVLENIYSFAEVYAGEKSVEWPPGASLATVAVAETFGCRRPYDRYLHKKEMNLK
jgi:hypothetical protein